MCLHRGGPTKAETRIKTVIAESLRIMLSNPLFFMTFALFLQGCVAPAAVEAPLDKNQDLYSHLEVERLAGFEAFIALAANQAGISWSETIDGKVTYQSEVPSPLYVALAVRTPLKQDIRAIMEPLHESVKALLVDHDVPAHVKIYPVATAEERVVLLPTPPASSIVATAKALRNRAAFRALTRTDTAPLDALPSGWIVVITGGSPKNSSEVSGVQGKVHAICTNRTLIWGSAISLPTVTGLRKKWTPQK